MVENDYSHLQSGDQSNVSGSEHAETEGFMYELVSSPTLDKALQDIAESLPDWQSIQVSFGADSRNSSGDINNMTGALAEHVARGSLTNCLLEHAENDEVFLHTEPMPDTVSQAGKYVFVADSTSGNYVVFDPETRQYHTEYDGVLALEDMRKETEPLIVVLESKLTIPRLPRNRGLAYMKKYVEHKLRPLRALFKTNKFSFVLTACKSNNLTRNQIRFMNTLRRMGGKISTLGVDRDELEAFAMSYL